MISLRANPLPLRASRPALFSPRFFSSTAPPRSRPPPVVGTAPSMPRHLLIHTPHPSSTWPSHLESTSRLYREVGKQWAKDDKLSKIGFNMTDGGQGTVEQEWDPSRPKFEEPPEGGAEEVYSATLYPDFLSIPRISLSTLPSLSSQLSSLSAPPSPSPSATSPPPRTHIFICTHGTRDCRCSDLGEPLYQALLKEIERRKVGGELKGHLEDGGVRIARTAHVGGHKWAGNALVYREGAGCDWYGLLRATDAPALLDAILSPSSAPLYSRWRGRLGMSSEEVKDAYSAAQGGGVKRGKKEERRNELGDPVEVVFATFEGEERRVKGYEGETLMETARRHDLPSILATCGGHCECATCHVHIPPLLASPSSSAVAASGRQPTPVPQDAPLPEMTDEEDEQLEFAIGADDDSRLACQIPVTRGLGEWCARGGRVKLPRY